MGGSANNGAGNNGMGGGGSNAGGGTGGSSAGSGTTSNGGSAESSSVCDQACQKVLQAACGDVTSCDNCKNLGSDSACQTETEAYFACISSTAKVTCDTANKKMQISGCDAQSKAVRECDTCSPAQSDTACESCLKGSCCAEEKAYSAATGAADFTACVKKCQDSACLQACAMAQPEAGKAYDAAAACETKGCATECLCAADARDSSCTACVKKSCCDLFIPYTTSADGAAFDSCITKCSDQACLDACSTASPVAGAAYQALQTGCLSTTCATACTP